MGDRVHQVSYLFRRRLVVYQADGPTISFEQTYIPSEGERARRATSSHLRRLFSDPNSSIPASPELRTTFSPLPSVPASPSLSSTPDDRTHSPMSSTETTASSHASESPLVPPVTHQAPPYIPDLLPGGPSLHPGKGDGLEPGLTVSTGEPPCPVLTSLRSSTRDLLATKTNADDDSHTDSDSTICAERPDVMSFVPAEEGNRSGSEGAISQRPTKVRRPRPVPSIASKFRNICKTYLA